MNKEEERRKLIWKYFWKRKRQEVRAAAPQMLFFQMAIFFVTAFIVAMADANGELLGIVLFLMGVFVIELFIVFIVAISSILSEWLYSNWELATEDAAQELNGRSRQR